MGGGHVTRNLRIASSVFIAALAIFGLHRYTYLPFRCDLEIPRLQRRTLAAMEADPRVAAPVMRANIERLQHLQKHCPTVVDLYLVLGANLRFVNRIEDAVKVYETALRYDRRPEIYLNLGVALYDMGDTAAAMDNFVRARMFNQFIETEVPAAVRAEVRRRATAIYPDR